MPKRPSLEDQLDRLSDLRDEPDRAVARQALAKALASKASHLLPARAAKVAAVLGIDDLEQEMAAAFDRLMVEPTKRDKGCVGKTALAKALLDLGLDATGVFLAGIRHVQLEPVWGGSEDMAQELRAWCAQGLARSGHPDSILELVPLLVDPKRPPRLAAARALGEVGRVEAEPLLRLKALAGDEEPEVVGECLASLLHLEPRRSLDFVGEFLHHRDAVLAEAAALALGESRLEGAVDLLARRLEDTIVDPELRRALFLGLAMSRRQSAFDLLLERVEDGGSAEASQALTALALHRHDEALNEKVEEILDGRNDRNLWKAYQS